MRFSQRICVDILVDIMLKKPQKTLLIGKKNIRAMLIENMRWNTLLDDQISNEPKLQRFQSTQCRSL